MKRFLPYLIALLPCAALAQSNINVSVTYTSGAAAAATTAGTTVAAKVTNVVDTVINPNLTANGITAQFTAITDSGGAMGDRAPVDSAPLLNVYTWAKYNVQPWVVRSTFDASISVHVTSTPGATSYAGSATAGTGGPNESVIVIPYALLDTQLELALAKVLNAGSGQNGRERSYAGDPLAGANYCWHSRESEPSDPSTLVGFPDYWLTSATTATKAQTQNSSCYAYQVIWNAQSPPPVYQAISYAVQSVNSSTAICKLSNPLAPGQIIANPYMYLYTVGGAAAIAAVDCPEVTLSTYTSASVTAMNARRADVRDFYHQNAAITGGKHTSLGWLACTLLSSC